MADISTYWFLNNYERLCKEAKTKMVFDRWNKDKIGREYAIKMGWWDWFCHESALIGRTEKYGKLIASVVKAIPILGKNTFVSFSQRLGEGYVDYIHIGRNDTPKFGYGIRVYNDGYYVYREGRGFGADFKSRSFREVVKFIEKDVIIWLAGGKTAEYRGYTYQDPIKPSYTQSRIKATKPYMVVPGSPVGDMVLQYRAKNRKKAKKKSAEPISKRELDL